MRPGERHDVKDATIPESLCGRVAARHGSAGLAECFLRLRPRCKTAAREQRKARLCTNQLPDEATRSCFGRLQGFVGTGVFNREVIAVSDFVVQDWRVNKRHGL